MATSDADGQATPKKRWKLPHARCPECGRVVAVQPPVGGDGSADVYRYHRTAEGGICRHSRAEVERAEYVEQEDVDG